MLTYQIRERVFRLEKEALLSWPADTEVRFHLLPLQPFGMEAGGGRTAVQGVPATAFFDANSGIHTIESQPPLEPLWVDIEAYEQVVTLRGNVLTIKAQIPSNQALTDLITTTYFFLPLILNVGFADPPIVSRVDGRVGLTNFRWELSDWSMRYEITTQERQKDLFVNACDSFDFIAQSENRRLVAALHYFHVACRLARRAETAGEFLSEVILNLSKTLEVLFPPDGDGKSRDAARAHLARLGYTDVEIENDFLPAMALRNEIDVGHVTLAVFTMEQLTTLHSYTERAERVFRELLKRVLTKAQSGEYQIASYELEKPHPRALEVIRRLSNAAASKEAESKSP